eukprot:NODE_1116_length_2601_cov_7.734842.p1 GENE.NODE_1116_length_2601_cov_7.734842~~NODE_1116_length_2601_cov_7.734842.p1  ORF type:complete len:729 (-),score=166.57 NODE_1116_length_2601_cov_7.734842:281-2467(-)
MLLLGGHTIGALVVIVALRRCSSSYCNKLTGGSCSWFACDGSRQARCDDDYNCVCDADMCSEGGRCVRQEPTPKKDEVQCSKLTGGSCRFFGCDASRHAICDSDGRCACPLGMCADGDACKPETDAQQNDLICNKKTGATCRVLPCDASRNADCNSLYECVCPDGKCAQGGVCSDYVEVARWADCPGDTGGTCGLEDCHAWRGAVCSKGKTCQCSSGMCAVDGACWPMAPVFNTSIRCPRDVGRSCPCPPGFGECRSGKCICEWGSCLRNGRCVAHSPGKRTALVLSSGGARGAFEAGLLEGICQSPSRKDLRDSWSLVAGTNVGGIMAAFLAQFEQGLQCSHAVPRVAQFWKTIKSSISLYASPVRELSRTMCLGNLVSKIASVTAFFGKGGLCSLEPLERVVDFEINAQHIKDSGMGLRIVATELATAWQHWWDEFDDGVLDGIKATFSAAPYIFPYKATGPKGESWYMDGTIVDHAPIIKALEEGADRVIALITVPNTMEGAVIKDPASESEKDELGIRIVGFQLELLELRYFVRRQVMEACLKFPNAEILGYLPGGSLGLPTKFDADHLEELFEMGKAQATAKPPVDLCELFGFVRSGPAVALLGSILPDTDPVSPEILFAAQAELEEQERAMAAGLAGAGIEEPDVAEETIAAAAQPRADSRTSRPRRRQHKLPPWLAATAAAALFTLGAAVGTVLARRQRRGGCTVRGRCVTPSNAWQALGS